jgi:hypothetical protein
LSDRFAQGLGTFLIAAAGAACGTWAMNRGAAPKKAPASGAFELHDKSGRRRALMGLTDAGEPALWFFDAQGRSRLNLGVYEDGQPFVVLNDASEQAVGLLRGVGADAPFLIMKAQGQDRMIMGLGASSHEPFLVRIDASGGKTAVFGKY